MQLSEQQWNLLKVGIKRLALGVQATEDSVLVGGQGPTTFTYTKKAAKEALATLEAPIPVRLNRRSLRLLESYCADVCCTLKLTTIPEYQRRITSADQFVAAELAAYLVRAVDKLVAFEYILDEVKKELKK